MVAGVLKMAYIFGYPLLSSSASAFVCAMFSYLPSRAHVGSNGALRVVSSLFVQSAGLQSFLLLLLPLDTAVKLYIINRAVLLSFGVGTVFVLGMGNQID